LTSKPKAEISTAINKVLLTQIAVAGLLFAAHDTEQAARPSSAPAERGL